MVAQFMSCYGGFEWPAFLFDLRFQVESPPDLRFLRFSLPDSRISVAKVFCVLPDHGRIGVLTVSLHKNNEEWTTAWCREIGFITRYKGMVCDADFTKDAWNLGRLVPDPVFTCMVETVQNTAYILESYQKESGDEFLLEDLNQLQFFTWSVVEGILDIRHIIGSYPDYLAERNKKRRSKSPRSAPEISEDDPPFLALFGRVVDEMED